MPLPNDDDDRVHRPWDLVGKVAVVTGATRGIGRAIALHLASRGSAVLGTHGGTSSEQQISKVCEEVRSANVHYGSSAPKIIFAAISLADPEAHQKLADVIQQDFDGHVDIYINNAATTDRTYPGELEPETLRKLLLWNIETPAMMIDTLVRRRLFRHGSRIIFISSAESVRANPAVHIYAATKAANEAMARAYANAFGGNDPAFAFMAETTVNSVLTGLTNTQGVQQYGLKVWNDLQHSWISTQAIPRLGQVEDVADVVGLLCGKESRWITGAKISANGGSIPVV